MNYNDFLSNNSNFNSNINNENQKLRDELNKCKKENEELKNKIILLKNENLKLSNELLKANKIISNLKNNIQQNNNISNLNEIIKSKDIEINNLNSQIKNNKKTPVNYEDIIIVHFISTDQKISCPIKCLKTETFAEVEEKLYQKYEEYRETNNNFIGKGKLILRFKKISENGIEDGDKIQLLVE